MSEAMLAPAAVADRHRDALVSAHAGLEQLRLRARELAELGADRARRMPAQGGGAGQLGESAVEELELLCRQLIGTVRAATEAARTEAARTQVPALPSPVAPTAALGAGAPRRGMAAAVARGAGLTAAGYAVSQLISLATYLVLARLVLPRQLGIYEAAGVLLGIGLIVGEGGLLAALVTRREQLEQAANSAFLGTVAGGLGLSALALAAAPVVGLVFGRAEVTLVAAAMAGTVLPRLLVIVPNALLQRRLAFLRRVVVDPLGTLAFGVGAVAAAAAGMGVWALVIGTYGQVLVNLACAWILSGWRPRPRQASWAMWRQLSRFGRPVLVGEIVRRAVGETPTVGLGRFAGPAALGQYSYAFRMAAQPVAATIDVGGYVLLSALARISAEPRRLAAGAKRALRWMCAGAFPLGMALVGLGHPLVVLLFGTRWSLAGDGAMALGVWAAAASIPAFANEAFKAVGRTEMIARMQTLSLLVTVIAVLALLPLGMVGVCAGLAVAALGIAVYAARRSAQALGLPVRALGSEIVPAAVAASVMGLALLALDRLLVHAAAHGVALGLVLVGAESVIGAALYGVCLLVLSPAIRAEAVEMLGWGGWPA